MPGFGTLAAADGQASKKTLKLYSSVPSRLKRHTLLNKGCEFNCGIRVELRRKVTLQVLQPVSAGAP